MQRRAFLLGAGAVAAGGVPGFAGVAEPTIVALGGGALDDRTRQRLVSMAPGRRVLLAPYSGPSAMVGAQQGNYLRSLGFGRVDVLNLSDPLQARRQIGEAGMIWFADGMPEHQVRSLRAAPEVMTALDEAWRGGTILAGAGGVAAVSGLMITGGSDGRVSTAAGLGFWPEAVLDTQVRALHREYRLKKVIARNPLLVGVGLDEGCMIVCREGRFTVFGQPFAIVTRSVGGKLSETRLKPGQHYALATP